MGVSSVLSIPPPAEGQAQQAAVQLPAPSSSAILGNNPWRESPTAETETSQRAAVQDEVKVQMEPPGEIAVYQFLNQDGTLVLQVPPQQVLNLAEAIAKELEPESNPPNVALQKGESNGH
jgi:hypothetical protein